MKAALIMLLFGFVTLGVAAHAEVAPITVRAPEAKAWIGQRAPFFVELRASGPFAGTASFDLPQLPGTVVMKIGNPVVSSQELEGQSWFVQTHEFALFSQRPGPLEVPAFAVRFSSRDGFTGPVKEVQAQTSAWTIAIERPPGSDRIGFLITTDAFTVTETWDPQPGPAQVGAVFKRTIVQRAAQLSGMALAPAPAPAPAPEGIRLYRGDAEIKDRLERGDFLGERRETITYLLAKPGAFVLPASAYPWWNPKSRQLQSKTSPAVTFEVAPASAARRPEGAVAGYRIWLWLPGVVLAAGLGAWQRRRLAGWARQIRTALNPPDRVAARRLMDACRRDDAAAAVAAWSDWREARGAAVELSSELQLAVLGLQRHLFGPAPSVAWRGDELGHAFGSRTASRTYSPRASTSALPMLNPQGGGTK
jgi:hypothetical protein